MPLPLGIYRADHVGSFLRPKEILTARAELTTNDKQLLRSLEDKHITNIVQKQLENGLRSITDGEFRREYFHLDYLAQLDGIKVEGIIPSTHQGPNGFEPPRLIVNGKLGHPRPIQVADFQFLQTQISSSSTTSHATAKVCIPSPTMAHFRGSRTTIDSTAYPTFDEFFTDLARVYQEELADLYNAGCRLVQLDDTNLAYLCDEDMAQAAATRHDTTTTQLTTRYVNLINDSIAKRPHDMTIAIHLCRGNFRSEWFARGPYDAVAGTLFPRLNVDVYFLEFDDARSGGFAPLRYLPADKVVVLGVLSSKNGRLPDRADVVARVNEAALYCPRGLDQICLSHQCGFSSTVHGNRLEEDEQWAKIRLEVDIAREIWGDGDEHV